MYGETKTLLMLSTEYQAGMKELTPRRRSPGDGIDYLLHS